MEEGDVAENEEEQKVLVAEDEPVAGRSNSELRQVLGKKKTKRQPEKDNGKAQASKENEKDKAPLGKRGRKKEAK